MGAIALLLLFGVLGGGVLIYNRLVRDKNRVLAAWSDIDVQLKGRHDLIPKLVAAVEQYAAFERATLTAVTQLRAKGTQALGITERARVEQALGAGVTQLLAVAERYPELKASANFLQLRRDLSEVENHIQFARRYYNGTVRNLNIRIGSFPDLIVARLFRFRPREYFEPEASALRAPQSG